MAFGNTYVESPLGHFGHEDVHRTAGRHGGSYTYDPWIGFRQFHQCISENVLEQGRHSFRIGYETLSGDGIELAGSVPFGGVFLGRGEAFSFDRVEMQYFGTFEVFNVTQYPRKVLYVMAIDRTEVADVHSFEYILLLGGH